jgi:hypothetical protein
LWLLHGSSIFVNQQMASMCDLVVGLSPRGILPIKIKINGWNVTTNLRYYCHCFSWLPEEKCWVCDCEVTEVCSNFWGLCWNLVWCAFQNGARMKHSIQETQTRSTSCLLSLSSYSLEYLGIPYCNCCVEF